MAAEAEKEKEKEKEQTFFKTCMPMWQAIEFTAEGEVPSVPFLDACATLNVLFEKMGTIISLVKNDINGNIRKLRAGIEKDQGAHPTLESLVAYDIEKKQTRAYNSNTESLLWLKRALEFIYVMLEVLSEGEAELSVAVFAAYDKTLKRYHGWLVQKTFGVAARVAGSREDFLRTLGPDIAEVEREMKDFLVVYKSVLTKVVDFYEKHDLDDPRKV